MAAKKPKGVYSKGQGVAGMGFPEPTGNRAKDNEQFVKIAEWASDTAETQKDQANTPSIISAAGRKYNADPKLIKEHLDRWNKVTEEVRAEKAKKGSQANHTVTSVDRKTGKSK